MEITFTQWYAISIAAVTVCLLLYRFRYITSYFELPFKSSTIKNFALKTIVYPLGAPIFPWGRPTILQISMVMSYYAINGFCMGLGIRTKSDLMRRTGILASINLIPLFLGGRTNIIANYLGISVHTYYLAHHWIGRIVIIQGLLHVALAIATGKPWTFDSSQISGISAASALALLFLLSLYFVRRLAYEFFLNIHIILAFVAAIGLLIHVLFFMPRRNPASSSLTYVIVALSLWGFNAALRFLRMAYRNAGRMRKANATITHYFDNPSTENVSAMRLSVRLKRPIRIRSPGAYCYLSFSDMGLRGRLQSHPYMITWWDNSEEATKLEFLIQPHTGISADLISRNSIRNVLIDGLYGKDLHLDEYETVILIAKGIGIVGILPHVRHMTYRRASKHQEHEAYRRGLITRKIDVLWVLEDNSQEDWVSEWMMELWKRDSEKLILTFTCFYPDKQVKTPPVTPDSHWRFIYKQEPHDIIGKLVKKQIQRSPGTTKIVVCGDVAFDKDIRRRVIETMGEYENVEFAATEFQPQEVRRAYPGIHAIDRDDIEMTAVEKRPMKSRLSTLPRTIKKAKRLDDVEVGSAKRSEPIEKQRVSEEAEIDSGKQLVLKSRLTALEEGDEVSALNKEEVKEFV